MPGTGSPAGGEPVLFARIVGFFPISSVLRVKEGADLSPAVWESDQQAEMLGKTLPRFENSCGTRFSLYTPKDLRYMFQTSQGPPSGCDAAVRGR